MIGQKLAVKLLMGYLADKPMEKLPRMISLAEMLVRRNLHASHIQSVKKALLDEGAIGCWWRTSFVR